MQINHVTVIWRWNAGIANPCLNFGGPDLCSALGLLCLCFINPDRQYTYTLEQKIAMQFLLVLALIAGGMFLF
jgi:hypothetical protein